MKFNIHNLAKYFWSIAAILLLIQVAIYNGFPVVFIDLGTYIYTGFTGKVPIDRPIVYGLFLRHVSLATTLWLVIVAQAIFVWFFIFQTITRLVKSSKPYRDTALVVIVLSLFTGVSYAVSQPIPDIFTAILILGLALLIAVPMPRYLQIMIILFLIFAAIVHTSNMATILSMGLVAITLFLILNKKDIATRLKKAIIYIGLISVGAWLVLPAINYKYGAGFVTSRIQNIFMTGSLLESGILQIFLAENCDDNQYSLCNYQNELPEYAFEFLWLEESPLYKADCEGLHWEKCWLLKNEEYGRIIHEIYTTPRYLKLFIWKGVQKTMRQLVDFELDNRGPERESSPAYGRIQKHFKFDFEQFINSRQMQNKLDFKVLSIIQYITVGLSFGFTLLVLFKTSWRKRVNQTVWLFGGTIYTGLLANAAVCAVFSNVVSRYQGRVIWLSVLVAVVLAYAVLRKESGELS